eukprot:6892996-Pyramimonas_sp.AAC.1
MPSLYGNAIRAEQIWKLKAVSSWARCLEISAALYSASEPSPRRTMGSEGRKMRPGRARR